MTQAPETMVPPNSQVTLGDARFTVIARDCIRMEYAPRQGFVDAPTLYDHPQNLRGDSPKNIGPDTLNQGIRPE